MTRRQKVFEKYGGKCAYTGKPLGEDWQIDHMTSKISHEWHVYYQCKDIDKISGELKRVNNIDNLMPALRIVNHYKRSLDLEGFRHYMSNFHKRLARLPKTTGIPRTASRIRYMNEVAEAFGITPDKPFSGRFYFETIKNKPSITVVKDDRAVRNRS